jgi:Holliday junction resolvase RusA-like endonuclease
VSGVERQRRQVQRDIDNVKGVIDAATQFQTLIDDVIAQLEHLQNRVASERGRAA